MTTPSKRVTPKKAAAPKQTPGDPTASPLEPPPPLPGPEDELAQEAWHLGYQKAKAEAEEERAAIPAPIPLLEVFSAKKTHTHRKVRFQITDQNVLVVFREDGSIRACYPEGGWDRMLCS